MNVSIGINRVHKGTTKEKHEQMNQAREKLQNAQHLANFMKTAALKQRLKEEHMSLVGVVFLLRKQKGARPLLLRFPPP